MEGYPDIRTVDYWVGDNKAERHPQSRTMNNHNKADGFERRLEVSLHLFTFWAEELSISILKLYLVENFKHAFDIER